MHSNHPQTIHPIPNPKDVRFNDWLGQEAYMPPEVVEEPEDAMYFIAIRRGPLVLACDKRVTDPDAPVDLDYDENDVKEDSWAFFDRLLKNANVVTTPGAGFGKAGEGYIRISAFNSRENVIEAISRLEGLL